MVEVFAPFEIAKRFKTDVETYFISKLERVDHCLRSTENPHCDPLDSMHFDPPAQCIAAHVNNAKRWFTYSRAPRVTVDR